MKSITTLIAASSLLAALAMAQKPRYTVTDLGTLPGGHFSQAYFVNNNGLVTGLAALADGTQHAVLWDNGRILDIGIPGYGGPNSGGFGVNDAGQVAIQAETGATDPNKENFCLYSTGLKCLPFLWQKGVMTPLATLGGHNGTVGLINNRGEITGIVETGIRDPKCPAGVAVTGTGPQVLDFEAVIWGPKPGDIRELRPLPGDSVSMAIGINDNGQAVGASGSCADSILPPLAAGPRAVLWEKDGSAIDMGSLGGTVNPALPGVGQMGLSINNLGEAVGASALRDNDTSHAFRWTRKSGMQDLGTLSGDFASAAVANNDAGEVVGLSMDKAGNTRAFVWKNGVMRDLNELAAPLGTFHLLFADGINARGEIVGFGATAAGEIHAFLATPVPVTTASAGPKGATVVTRQTTLDGTASISGDGKPLTYSWTIPQGSPSAGISQGNTATPTIQFSLTRGIYTLQLTVTDSTGTSASDTVTINYQGN